MEVWRPVWRMKIGNPRMRSPAARLFPVWRTDFQVTHE